jgi:D-3-phosphoglycerate dehydrogenase / 2-oxoglutarate reductase
MTWRILNTLDISGAPEASAALNEAGALVCKEAIREDILQSVSEFDAYMVSGKIEIDKEVLDAAPKLKLIGSPHTGTDHLDLEEIQSRGIELFTISKEIDLLEEFTATSELAFGLLLSLVRKLPQAFSASKEGNWAREYFTGFQLRGKTIGVLGLGRLGKISAQIANGFGMRVIAHDIRDIDVDGVEMVDVETLFTQSDVISVHIHLNDETRGLVDTKAFALMKSNAIILNTSRGGILDETALLSALMSGSIGGAGLDVIDGEWLSHEDLLKHPLIAYSRTHENLLISPHVGGSTTESIYGARVFMARKMANFIRNYETQSN